MRWALRLALLLPAVPALLVFASGLPALGLLDWRHALWAPPEHYGVLGVALGTIGAAGFGSVLAVLFGYGVGVQLAYRGRSARPVGLLAATPVVLFGAALLGPLRPLLTGLGLGEGIGLAAVGLALVGLPDAAYAARDAALGHRGAFHAALALGAAPDGALLAVRPGLWRALWRVLPLVFARLAGEAALASLLIGNAGGWPAAGRPSGAIAPTLLAEVLQAPPGSAWQERLLGLSAVILLLGLLAGVFTGGAGRADADG